ncbi:MAG: 4-hydroxy-tetrahydrodipicolinate synthase [Deltaproteobacteria bacterium]|nr:4-hydroxy-tetrahydrodipicolinate synthase [Deltaproteobacteria bacterium]
MEGVLVALVTPFKEGSVDYKALHALIDFQIENGTDGIVPCGTTGESATLCLEEKKKVIEETIEHVRKRALVIAGTGSNNTRESVTLTKWAKDAGADGALVVTPYYNKPTQNGLYEHYKAISRIGLPLCLYNVPSRTSVSLTVATIEKLVSIDEVVAIKEATASMVFASEIIKACGDKIKILSGDDPTFLPLLSLGGKGIISVTSNVAPQQMADIYDHFILGQLSSSREAHYHLLPLMNALFWETNPIPVKKALHLMGKIEDEVRLPLTPLSQHHAENLKTLMQEYHLL